MNHAWAANRKLLIVDDMPAIRLLLREIARPAGFEISESWNCSQTIVQLSTFEPDIVLLDRGLPDGDGLALIDAIRAGNGAARVIVVTASDERRFVEDAMSRGACGYIVKPFAPRHVLIELQRCLPESDRRPQIR